MQKRYNIIKSSIYITAINSIFNYCYASNFLSVGVNKPHYSTHNTETKNFTVVQPNKLSADRFLKKVHGDIGYNIAVGHFFDDTYGIKLILKHLGNVTVHSYIMENSKWLLIHKKVFENKNIYLNGIVKKDFPNSVFMGIELGAAYLYKKSTISHENFGKLPINYLPIGSKFATFDFNFNIFAGYMINHNFSVSLNYNQLAPINYSLHDIEINFRYDY